MQHPKDQSVDQRNHLPGQYTYCPNSFPGNIYIALVAGKYMKYCPALAFDPPTQSGTYRVYALAVDPRLSNHLCTFRFSKAFR